jgi:hypothetical protein
MSPSTSLRALAVAAFAAFGASCSGHDHDDTAHADDTAHEADTDTDTDADTDADTDTGVVDPLTTDDDLDGVSENDGDCNDRNDAVHPGARERSFDGVDSDCDGAELPAGGADRYAEALPLLDTDEDGSVSFEEFDAACTSSAMVLGEANPGVVQTHVSCGGANSCRGMVLHPWNELYEHDCRGVNGCAGWSCVETVDGEGRDGATVYTAATCNWCHGGEGTFLVHTPAGEDPESWLATFFDRTDTELRSAIAFGLDDIDADGVATRDMPGFHERISRAEMDAVLTYIRTLPVAAPPEEE